MGAELDGLFVKVLCLMDDADAFHETIDSLSRSEYEWLPVVANTLSAQDLAPRSIAFRG
jgi:hypothetical protein